MKVVIFTQTYPSTSSAEQTFIGRELPYLLRRFDNIIIIPEKYPEENLPLPQEVTIENKFAVFYKKQGVKGIIINALRSKYFYQEILQKPSVLLSINMLLRLIKFVGDTEIRREWAKNWIENKSIDISNSLFYSFWFTQIAMGLGLLRETCPNIRIISRAHGYDIYEERYHPPYFPCRIETLKRTDALFLASLDAHRYMEEKYPAFSQKYHTAHLGVNPPGFLTQSSKDNIFRIVSCSSIIPLKRVELLAESITLAAKTRPQQQLQWVHFGDGKRKKHVEKIIDQFPPSAKAELKGWVPNKEILAYYEHHPVDIFVNLSTTEGGAPVSIQEAISCGIPVIATNVGGNPEIVSEENGILLKADPTPAEIAEAFFALIDNPDLASEKRRGSINIWNERYNASKNFNKFARQIASLVDK